MVCMAIFSRMVARGPLFAHTRPKTLLRDKKMGVLFCVVIKKS